MSGTIWNVAAKLAGMAALAAVVCAALIVVLRPLLRRCALARPNARSSHREPTPQGGGIAVVAATVAVVAAAAALAPDLVGGSGQLAIVFAATLGLAVVGVTDDIHPLEAAPRLILQAAAVGMVVAALPAELRIVPMLPWWVERALLLLAGVWLVNLVNFMDGIDWMTVAEVVPLTAALAVFGLAGALPPQATAVALVLCGATIGFAPFNRPVASLFLGDVGSLPIGLLLFWLLCQLAGGGHLIAALLLPLYYLADATLTLLWRLARAEPIMQAHRSHFYQRAVDRGFRVRQIVARIFIVNIVLCALAATTLATQSAGLNWALLAVGCGIVAALLAQFARGYRTRP